MKTISKILGPLFICACASAHAEPVMSLITVNTNDAAGYAAWAKGSAKTIATANGAMAMGLCSPTSGAQKMGDHYLWSFFDSQEAAWSVDPMNAVVRAEVAKLDVKREVRMWDNWRIVRAAEVSGKAHYYNLHVKTDNPSGYIAALDKVHAEMKKRDLDVTMQVYMGDTGETAGLLMVSFGSSDRAEVGRMLDTRTEDWFTDIISGLEGKREMVHGFSLVCETFYATQM